MSDIAWVRKYRPSSFDDYMGDNVKNLVINRFKDRKNIPNTIMLYGTRGTGKTSMARLLAKEIHCMNPVDGHSCGECEMCQEIDRYITSTEAGVECYGITEVDAATTNGKSDLNDIIEDAIIEPLYPLQFKVVILDECHQLSKAAQNSLLKVFEEPPRHLIFILATTDPQNVLQTIHSRVQLRIEVRKKTVDEIANRLYEISQLENLNVSMEALRIIAKKGDRVPRECINLLESVAKNCGNVVTLETIRSSLGDISNDIYMDYFKAANTSMAEILKFNKRLKEQDISAKQFMQGLMRFILDACYIKNGISFEDYPVEFIEKVKRLFDMYRSAEFDTALQIIEIAAKSIDDDDVKSELTITTTALRLGKVTLLSKGLNREQEQAEKENKESLSEYKRHLEEDEKKQFEKVATYSATKEALSNVFKNMSDVKNSASVISASDKITTEAKTSGDKDDRFIDKSELESLMD